MTQEFIDAKINTKTRLSMEHDLICKKGKLLQCGIIKELDIQTAMRMQIQLDVLSQDPSKDADGYTIVSADGTLNGGISKADYEAAMLELKQIGFALWGELQQLIAQVDQCETMEELDALQFSE